MNAELGIQHGRIDGLLELNTPEPGQVYLEYITFVNIVMNPGNGIEVLLRCFFAHLFNQNLRNSILLLLWKFLSIRDNLCNGLLLPWYASTGHRSICGSEMVGACWCP